MTETKKTEKPTVIDALWSVMAEVGAVGKDSRNQQQGYNFRGIDDVYNAIHPHLAKHGVIIVPEVEERIPDVRQTTGNPPKSINVVHLRIRYRFYGPAGDHIEAVVWGEGQDSADKATNKAMSAAMKYALFQVFSIPTQEQDADATTEEAAPARRQQTEQPKPPTARQQVWRAAKQLGMSNKEEVEADYAARYEGSDIAKAGEDELAVYHQALLNRVQEQENYAGGEAA